MKTKLLAVSSVACFCGLAADNGHEGPVSSVQFCANCGIRALLVETGHDNAAAQGMYRRAGFAPTDRLHLTLPLADPTHVG